MLTTLLFNNTLRPSGLSAQKLTLKSDFQRKALSASVGFFKRFSHLGLRETESYGLPWIDRLAQIEATPLELEGASLKIKARALQLVCK